MVICRQFENKTSLILILLASISLFSSGSAYGKERPSDVISQKNEGLVKQSLRSEDPIEIEVVSMPSVSLFGRYMIQILTGGVVALITFILTIIAFRRQRIWQKEDAAVLLKRKQFNQLIVILSEMKRTIDRCRNLLERYHSKGGEKSLSNLYMKVEEVIFPHFFETFDKYDITNKILATYTLFSWVNWNINLDLHPYSYDKEGRPRYSDRYGAAIGFLKTYIWGASKNFNEILEYAKELEKPGGKTPDFLVAYDLEEIGGLPYTEVKDLN